MSMRRDESSGRQGMCVQQAGASGSAPANELGVMPVWNLGDLYPGIGSKQVEEDLAKAATAAASLKQRYQGKLAALADDGSKA